MRVLKYLNKGKAVFNAEQVLYWTEKLDPQAISTETYSFTDSTGKQRILASAREDWFALRTKALFARGLYQECLDLAEQGLNAFDEFHYDNDIWFQWRIARCKGHLGRTTEAIDDLRHILPHKNEWFVLQELARMLHETGSSDEALILTQSAALKPNEPEFFVKLYAFMSVLFQEKQETQIAIDHLLLSLKIRQQHQQKLPPEDTQRLHQLGGTIEDPRSADDLTISLRRIWQSSRPRHKGVIQTVNTEKGFGFIQNENGKSHHFRLREFKGASNLLQTGQHVTFFTEMSFDSKKGKESEIAVQIRADGGHQN